MNKIGCTSLVINPSTPELMLGISGGRGITMVGGKREVGEMLKDAAARELYEESGLVAKHQELLFNGANVDEYHVYVFLTTVEEYSVGFETHEGKTVNATWDDFFASSFGPFYEAVQDAYRRKLEIDRLL